MKSQGRRKAKDADDELNGVGGGKMLKVLALMNEGNKTELELRKFMFESEMKQRTSKREKEAEERKKNRDLQAQQMQLLQ